MTSRELVYMTLEHKNTTGIVPRQLQALPYAEIQYPGMIDKVKERFPEDIGGVPCSYSRETIRKGNQFKKGEYTDEWGCVFTNIHEGVIGEVKSPSGARLTDSIFFATALPRKQKKRCAR